MRRAYFAFVSLVATTAFAQNVRFDPPNPTLRTSVTARGVGNFSTCSPTNNDTQQVTAISPQ